MNSQSVKKQFSRLKIKLLQRIVFVWHTRLKVMTRVKEEMHELLRNITRFRRRPLKSWEKPVNQNHENACIVAIIVLSDPLSILI